MKPVFSMEASTPSRAETAHDPAWHALVDGKLSSTEAETLQQHLAGDAAALATVAQWQAQRERLRALHNDMLHSPVPRALLDTVTRAQARRDAQQQWWRWGGMAASVAVAFGLGWLGRGYAPQPGHGGAVAVAAAAPATRFAAQAAVAHAVFQPEQRHPVEVPAAQQEHLVQWLSKRLGRPLKVPALSSQGYELMGGRLLPGDTGARAQFMYQNSAGERVTLYLGALTPPASRSTPEHSATPERGMAAPPSETAFLFTNEGPVPGFYWTDGGFGYALSGQLSRPALQALATAVHQQL